MVNHVAWSSDSSFYFHSNWQDPRLEEEEEEVSRKLQLVEKGRKVKLFVHRVWVLCQLRPVAYRKTTSNEDRPEQIQQNTTNSNTHQCDVNCFIAAWLLQFPRQIVQRMKSESIPVESIVRWPWTLSSYICCIRWRCCEGNLGIIITYWLQTRPRLLCLHLPCISRCAQNHLGQCWGRACSIDAPEPVEKVHQTVSIAKALQNSDISCHMQWIFPCRCAACVLCEVLSTLHAGDSFGELSLLYNIRREAREIGEKMKWMLVTSKNVWKSLLTFVIKKLKPFSSCQKARQRSEPSRIRLCLSGAELAQVPKWLWCNERRLPEVILLFCLDPPKKECCVSWGNMVTL